MTKVMEAIVGAKSVVSVAREGLGTLSEPWHVEVGLCKMSWSNESYQQNG